jgi:hypothetical protein
MRGGAGELEAGRGGAALRGGGGALSAWCSGGSRPHAPGLEVA